MFRYHFFIIAFLLVFPFSIFAEEQGPVVEIDKIVVVESVSSQTDQDQLISPSAQINIKQTAPKTESAADVVSQTAGVHIRRYGGLDEASSISIRGSSHNQVNVFLDGVPLDTASADGVGLSHIAASSLSKIQVYKSLSPSEFGGSAIGGVVNLKTKDVDEGFSHRHGFGFGSFYTFDVLSELSFGGNKNDVVFGITYRRTRGDFDYLDNNGTPLNEADDQVVKRTNNHKQTIHPYVTWKYQFNEKNLIKISQHLFRIDSGVPGLANFQSQTASKSLTEFLGNIDLLSKGHFKNKTQIKNKTYYRLIKSQFSDLNAEIGIGQAQDNDNHTLVLGNRHVWQTDFSQNIILKNGFEYIFEWFYPKDYLAANPIGSKSSRHQINIFLEPHFYIFHKKVLLSSKFQSLNAFYDINNDDPSLNSAGTYFSNKKENDFSSNVAVQYIISQPLHIKLSAAREVRLPKFVEMFGDQGFVLGNASLMSEKSFKWDVGAFYTQKLKGLFNQLNLEASYFESYIDDLIQFEMASGYARASNIGQAKVRGVELSVRLKMFKMFHVMCGYTYQQPKDEALNPNNYLVGRPKHEVNSTLSFNKANFSSALHANFIDGQYLDALNTQQINKRLVLNIEAGYFIKQKYRLGFEVKNVTNSQVVDAVGFPLPGRSYFGRLDVFF